MRVPRRLPPRSAAAIVASLGLHLLIAILLPRGDSTRASRPDPVHELELRAVGPTLAISPPPPSRLALAQRGDPAGRSPHGPAVSPRSRPGGQGGRLPSVGADLDELRFAPYAARGNPGPRSREDLREPAPYLPARDGEVEPGERLTRIPKDGEVALPRGLRVAVADGGARPGGAGEGAGQGAAARRGSPDGTEHGAPLWLTGNDRRYADYFRRIYRKVQPLWVFPKELEVVYEQGEVIVQFSILADGTVRDLRVRKSSGYRRFDANVLAAIEKAAPFGPIPRGLGRRLDILAPFEFANPMVR